MNNKKLGQESAFGFGYEAQDRYGSKYGSVEPRISKRMYIATAAMQGMCTNHLYQGSHRNDPKDLVRIAYELADEMLKQESEEIND